MKQLKQYTYTLAPNASLQIPATNDNFIVQASEGPITVIGDTFGTFTGVVAGQGLRDVPFGRLELVNETAAPNQVTLLLTPAEFVNQVFTGAVSVLGSLSLDAATLNTLTRPSQPTANWNSGATMAANTPLTVFLAAANVNGAIVWRATAYDEIQAIGVQSFVAKATAPTTWNDGDVIAQSTLETYQSATARNPKLELQMPQRIAPGLGLYFISSLAGLANAGRSCRFTLL